MGGFEPKLDIRSTKWLFLAYFPSWEKIVSTLASNDEDDSKHSNIVLKMTMRRRWETVTMATVTVMVILCRWRPRVFHGVGTSFYHEGLTRLLVRELPRPIGVDPSYVPM